MPREIMPPLPTPLFSYDFRSCPSALALSAPTLQRIIEDCQCVFGKGGGSEKTWWVRPFPSVKNCDNLCRWVACDGAPRCALEQLALAVFEVYR